VEGGKGFIYDRRRLNVLVNFPTQVRMGPDHDDRSLILSDGTMKFGSSTLRTFLSNDHKSEVGERSLKTSTNLNMSREIFANIWQDDRIVRIDPNSGAVVDG